MGGGGAARCLVPVCVRLRLHACLDGAAGEQVAVHAVHIPVHSVADDDADEVVAVPTPEPGSASSSPDPMRKGKGKGSRGTMVTIGT